MQIVIYRDKETNQIKSYHEANKYCTTENLEKYNHNANNTTKAEIVELEENSVAEYFYNLKTTSIKQEYENLRELENTLDNISYDISCRLDALEKLVKEQEVQDA